MSLKTWLAEYYPVPADRAAGDEAGLEHAIRKWKGAMPAALKKHGCRVNGERLVSDTGKIRLMFGHKTCVLCQRWRLLCSWCLLNETAICGKAWLDFCRTGGPERMIRGLQRALRELRRAK
jgi:hypothetical protein